MSTNTEQDAVKRGYESRDAAPRPVLITGVSLVALMFVGLAAAIWFWQTFEDLETQVRPTTSPVYARQVPRGPRLQANPDETWLDYKKTQIEFLQSYGWIDESAGVVHVPVELAMEKVLADGLPSWKTPDPEPTEETPSPDGE
ncbi:MAG: hypothetical protein AAGD10_01590 [Myxococcota bacterium]